MEKGNTKDSERAIAKMVQILAYAQAPKKYSTFFYLILRKSVLQKIAFSTKRRPV